MKEVYEKFFNAINQLHRIRIGDLFPEMKKADGITLMAIAHYNRKNPDSILTVSELAEKIHTKPSAVSRTLKGLEKQGLIVRTVMQTDRRNIHVMLSEVGKVKCKEMERTMNEFAGAVLSRMNEQDLLRMVAYLNKLHQVAVEEIELRKNRKEETYEKDF